MHIKYRPTKTLARFHKSDAFVRGVMGPIGSGKSVGMCAEIYMRALRQAPGPDNVRRSRWAIIRNTYPELKSTTIKTFSDWVPEAVCPISFSAPVTGRMKGPLQDGTTVDMEVFFLALDSDADVKKLLSLELTGAWLNEARELPRSVLDMLTGRVGRYPSMRDGGPSWSGIILDTNPPDEDHWWYSMAEVTRPQGYEFFRQPGALLLQGGNYVPNPYAENVSNHTLGYEYWLRQVPGKDPMWINVYVLGNYGTILDGKLVYPEYDDGRHCATEVLEPYRGLPLLLGWDFGLTPAVAICQITPKGQFRVIDELISEDMGIRRFATEHVRPYLLNNYAGMLIDSTGDPAGTARAQSNESTCYDELRQAGYETEPARTNEFTARREAVAGFMTKMDGEGNPAFLVSPKAKTIRKGFLGGYHFERVKVSNERYKDKPAKNLYSHVHDGLQYAALKAEGVRNVAKRRVRPVRAMSAVGWT